MSTSYQASIGGRLIGISYRVVYGDPKEVRDLMGLNTAYVEKDESNLPADECPNGSKDSIISKEDEMLEASCAWEDCVYNLTRPVKSLRVETSDEWRPWLPTSAAMAAGLTDHIWTIEELMMTVVVPDFNTK